jgi:tetratricopeptide (TPR) repeat protein
MKKQYILTILCFNLLFTVEAQSIQDTLAYTQWRNLYLLSQKYGDYTAAKVAVMNMMILNNNNIGLADTLANIYFDARQYASCALVCSDIISANPNYLPSKEMRAICYENLGLKDRALADYESIYLLNNSVFTLYKVALIQRELSRFSESKTNLDIIVNEETAREIKLVFSDADNNQQEIPLAAAAYNIKGLIELAQSNNMEAQKNFNKALEVAPEFYLPKKNLEDLEK